MLFRYFNKEFSTKRGLLNAVARSQPALCRNRMLVPGPMAIYLVDENDGRKLVKWSMRNLPVPEGTPNTYAVNGTPQIL